MSLASVVEWTRQTFMPLGPLGLFVLAFIESSFFPVPPDVLLIPLVLASPHQALLLAAIATAGSVTGAMFGYELGRRGGRPVLERMVSQRNIDRVEGYYDRYGALAVGFAGFSPVPYKVFAVSSGTFEMDLPTFVTVSTLSRGARFFAEAILFMLYGEEIMSFFETYFGPLTLVAAGLAVAGYVVWKQWL
ncbi:MAG: VTT domain-containing protein [Candidatus Nanohaloarchaea archaeon]|nr:VTT domain-containing protein [Candidatus Nanohaloarchaea archaeon]